MTVPGEPPPAVPPRILVIEDNEDNRDIVVRRLTRRGFTLTAAVDGFEGLRLAKDSLPDLILLDLQMPGMDGYEVLRQLKAFPPTRAIPVIILTSHVLEDHERQARMAGCDDFETKPVNFPRLIGKMLLCLGHRPSVDPPAANGASA